MGIVLRVLAGKAGPWLLLGLIVAMVGGAVWLRTSAYSAGKTAGVKAERQAWQQVAQKAKDQAEQLATERQARKDEAALARSERDKLYATKVAPIKLEVQTYARSPAGAVRCVDDAGVRLGQKAIGAANSALAARTSRGQ